MKRFFNAASRFWFARSLGILIIRLEVGFVFLTHGLTKVEHLSSLGTTWMGFPVWVGVFIAWLEVIGGLALIAGILTRVFAVMFGIEMLVAVALSLHRAAMTVGGMAPSWQSAIGGMEMFLAIMSFALALMGSGKYALYAMECLGCGAMRCDGPDCPGPQNP